MGLNYASVVDAPLGEVFAWHARPGAVTRLMPPWPPVQVEREAGSVRDGQAVLPLAGGPPARRVRPAARVRRRPGLAALVRGAAVAAYPPVRPGRPASHPRH